MYHFPLKALGLEQNPFVSYDSYARGRTLIAFDMIAKDVKEADHPEFSCYLRTNMFFSKASNPADCCFCLGTHDILRIK